MHGEQDADGSSQARPGQVIAGRYELRRRLGQGGMGEVWEALDVRLDRKVAVKGLLSPRSADLEARVKWVHRARREAQAVARIGHQNVVAVHDVIEADGQVWIVMELLDSRSLADLLRDQQQLSVPHAARIGLQVLRGLTAAHAAGVLHRDVKPHNILFRADGRALLMDFGIATFEGAAQLTRSHEIIGTPHYLAPELLSRTAGQPSPATPASDLWSLGVTLYEMVEGRRPFEGPDAFAVMIAVRDSPLPPPRFAGPLAPLIDKLLRKDPQLRPDAQAVEWDFQDVVRDLPTLDTPSAPRRPATSEPTAPEPEPEPAALRPPAGQATAQRPSPASGTETALAEGRAEPSSPAEPASPAAARPTRRGWRIPAAVVCAALLAGGGWLVWGQGDGTRGESPSAGTTAAGTDRKPLFIGVKYDQPGLGFLDKKRKKTKPEGFEVDLGKEIAKYLGYDPDTEVKFPKVTTDSRTGDITDDKVDLVIATFSERDEREAPGIDFAGPYFENPQGNVLVREKGRADIDSLSDLRRGDLKVCTAKGSEYRHFIRREKLTLVPEPPEDYETCLRWVQDSRSDVYGLVTDDVIVKGMAANDDDARALTPFNGEAHSYGVAMKAGNDALKDKVCAALEAIMTKPAGGGLSRWQELYKEHLEYMGQPPEEPSMTMCR
jgi:serine/threonine protein kinase/ABC-type amino acid transport substrate-binding protein